MLMFWSALWIRVIFGARARLHCMLGGVVTFIFNCKRSQQKWVLFTPPQKTVSYEKLWFHLRKQCSVQTVQKSGKIASYELLRAYNGKWTKVRGKKNAIFRAFREKTEKSCPKTGCYPPVWRGVRRFISHCKQGSGGGEGGEGGDPPGIAVFDTRNRSFWPPKSRFLTPPNPPTLGGQFCPFLDIKSFIN